MNRSWTLILVTLLMSPSLYGASQTTHMWCNSLENSSTLMLKLESPDPTDDCDISYDDDCGKTRVNYSLVSDLTNPHVKVSNSSTQDQYTDTFFEKEINGLQFTHGDFEVQLAAGFRDQLLAGQKVPVTIESHVVSQGTGVFQLYCQLR